MSRLVRAKSEARAVTTGNMVTRMTSAGGNIDRHDGRQPNHSEPSTRAWAPWLAGIVPLCIYVWTTGANSYWLDSGEFTATSVYLDIAHPPGHPITALWGRLFTLLPLGPLPFRVAFGQGVAAALALAFSCVAFARSLSLLGLRSRTGRELLALAGSWLLAASYVFWFQAVRQEVYALAALCVCASLERLTLAAKLDGRDPRPFYAATLALGMGLANHHLIAILGIPALGYELVRLTRVQRAKPWIVGLGLGALGLATYVYLPIRASQAPPLDLGHPTTLGSFWWVVSAQVYARKIGFQAVQPLDERFADLAVLIIENVGVVLVLLALVGSYVLVRTKALRGLAFAWGITVLVSLCGRAFLGPVRGNPDVLGYMMPGFAALVALGVCGAGAVLALLEKARPRPVLASSVIATLAALFALAHGAARASLADFHATDEFDDLRRRELPAQSVLLLLTPETVFRHWDGEAVERLRPDVAMVPVPFLGYGDSGKVLAKKRPELARIIEGWLESDILPRRAVLALSDERPVFIEGDATSSLAFFANMLPQGLLFRVSSQPVSPGAVRNAARGREAGYALLARKLDGQDKRDEETRRKLLWLHYTDALYYAYHGLSDEAQTSVQHGLALEPRTKELNALSKALHAQPGVPLDIRPFLVGSGQ
jgi:hypothetical protein